jgi:CheY-like chemotaxis protein
VITGWNVEEEEITGRGFAFLARKPFDIEELFTAVAACLNQPCSQGDAAAVPPRVLLVDPAGVVRDALTPALVQKGYDVSSACALDEAQALLDEHCFHLILADLPGGAQFGGQAHLLLRLARPTPVAVITDQRERLDEALEQGFAFCAPASADLGELLRLIDATIKQPMSEEQTRQAEIARRFCAAIDDEDWEALATLCDKEVICYPPKNSAFVSVRELHGFHAYRAYAESARHSLPGYHVEEVVLYVQPQGIAARYRFSWTPLDSQPQHLSVAKLMRFKDERVHEMRFWTDTDRLRSQRALEKRSSA